jgi:TlyA family rRNA methyltransferase/putative hemolysin
MGLVTSEEVERLQKQVADLKREVSAARGGGARPGGTREEDRAKKATAKKTAAKKAAAKKTTAKKATAKKATAKKTAAKKATAKKTTAKNDRDQEDRGEEGHGEEDHRAKTTPAHRADPARLRHPARLRQLMDAVDGSLDEGRSHLGPGRRIGADLDGLDERPVAEHVEVLERVNAAIARSWRPRRGLTLATTRRRLDAELVRRDAGGQPHPRAGGHRQGLVTVDGAPAFKPATQVTPQQALVVARPPRAYVSRGGDKLAHALEVFGVDPAGRHALDAGVSTGGFTDCLLQRGAVRVLAYDVGYGQLHESLRTDPRVVLRERTNVRSLTADDVPPPPSPDLLVADLSFISLALVLPGLRPLLSAEAPRRSCWSSPSSRPSAATSATAGSSGTRRCGDVRWSGSRTGAAVGWHVAGPPPRRCSDPRATSSSCYT